MKLEQSRFIQGLSSGYRQLGLWISLSHDFEAEVVADAGFDRVLIDMEHSPND